MFKLNTYLLLILISFSFQDKNCLAKFKICMPTEDEPEDEENCEGIENCASCDSQPNICDKCKDGYAITSDQHNCKPFQNCVLLETGDEKCKTCSHLFHLDDRGQCEKTFCLNYMDDICNQCADGYYLNDENECIKIPISECKEYDKDNKKCTKCVDGDVAKEDGNCNQHVWIEGCEKYKNGKCIKCEELFYNLNSDDGRCEFKNCDSGERVYDYCEICQAGYVLDDDDICIGYDGSKDTSTSTSSSKNNKAGFDLLIFILALLI